MARPSNLFSAVAVAGALAVVGIGSGVVISGCNQGAGERCEVDRDCISGYICGQKSAADSTSGVCIPRNGITTPTDSGATDSAAEVTSSEVPAEVTSEVTPEVSSELPAEAPAEAAPETPDAATETTEDAPVEGAADVVTAETGG